MNINKTTAPSEFLSSLINAYDNFQAGDFMKKVNEKLKTYFDDFTPEQDADSALYWEPEGCSGWLSNFELADSNFEIIEHDEDYPWRFILHMTQ
ncbi:hypothetical protein Xmau_03769 [Xenorhabdus mauleonii]|uniref:Uncharacterized protein n=1 Tax=Xenorhabdus mauleonii TaxID=351675 RepID=A0A1I3XZU1_9GAMM|nr:hypothetical protein [Xenorhabdus mauleonii]PHM37805.1 hypothetical protein Xmau_03769 [Xenorhabdus mauleonii]SFK25040.1 hypothetical protein SAMN05421680_1419 [Xenorhabdus mauleonii]